MSAPTQSAAMLPGEVDERARVAQAVSDAALQVPGVTRLVCAPEAVTHHRGGTVAGVRLGSASVAVHVAVDRLPLTGVTDAVRAAVRAALTEAATGNAVESGTRVERAIEIVVEDLDWDTEAAPTTEGP